MKNMLSNKIYEWLDNSTDPPGILKFAWQFFPDFRKTQTPEFHKTILREILSLYDVKHTSKFDRQLGIVAFRGSAKTTIDTFLLPIYQIVFKGMPSIMKKDNTIIDLLLGEELIVMTSKVGYMAVQRLVNVRNFISGDNEFTQTFGKLKPLQVRDGTSQAWRQDLFLCDSPNLTGTKPNGTHLLGLGAGQMIRGQNIGSRPTLIVFDDIYSIENVTTPERRAKIDEWFYTEAQGSVDDINGKMIFIGTIVHEDTVPLKIKAESKEANPQWKYLEIPAMDVDEFHKMLERVNYDSGLAKFEMPLDTEIAAWEKECVTISWKDRIGLKYLFNVYRSNLRGKTLDYIYQEYLNVVQSPDNKQFSSSMFVRQQLMYKRENEINWIHLEDEDKWYNCNIFFGVDLASSERLGADDTVICIICVLPDYRIAVLQIKSGKMGQRDELFTSDNKDTYRRQPHEIKKQGVVDEVLRLADIYYPDIISVEVVSEQLKTFQEIRRVGGINGRFHMLHKFKPTTNKLERIVSILLGHYQVGSVIHNKGMAELEYQLEKLGKAKHDDMADALHIAVNVGSRRIPVKMDYDNKNTFKTSPALIKDWQLL